MHGASTPADIPPEPAPLAAPSMLKGRRALSLFQKLLLLILSLVTSVVVLLAVYLPARQLGAMQTALERKTAMYGRLVAKQVESAVAFNDKETAREVFESVAQDPEVESLTLFDARGDVLWARGSLSPELAGSSRGVETQELRLTSERLAAIAPVVSLEGPRGTLVVELSSAGLREQRQDVLRHAALAGLVALGFGGLCAFWIASLICRRLRAVASAADAVAAGDLGQEPVDPGSQDEIGRMATAFNTMLEHIRSLVDHIQTSAREEQARLEHLVGERTRELDLRNEDMRRVLDNVEQGFLTLDLDGSMSRERSAILERWLGRAPASDLFADYLEQASSGLGDWFSLGWEAVVERLVPIEVCLDQLPKRLRSEARELELQYRPIRGDNGAAERVLVVITDVTAARERARAEAEERELIRLFTRMIADRAGFLAFFAEAGHLIEQVTSSAGPRTAQLERSLHTLKGNLGIYGLETVAVICHALEDKLAETGALSADDLNALSLRWSALALKVDQLLGKATGKIEIELGEHEEVLDALARGVPRSEISRRVQRWLLEPTQACLARCADQATALAERLGKAPIQLELDSQRLRLDSESFGAFWAASVHVLRNSIDHGLETPDERRALGKPVPAKLRLSTRIAGDRFVIEFSDDGRGIDWAAVARRARSLGRCADGPEALVEALFVDGLSTRSEISELSGRGVGLAAVRQTCQELGGRVEVESQPGSGTTFRFVFPAHVAMDAPAQSGTAIRRQATSVPAGAVIS